MKKFISWFFSGLTLLVLLTGCHKEEEGRSESVSETAQKDAEMDQITDDFTNIIENEYQLGSGIQSGKVLSTQSWLPDCATVTVSVAAGVVTRTVNFGTTGCALPNGNILKGKLIVTFLQEPTNPQIINYSFDNFYHNNRLIQGNRTVSRTVLSNGHPQATIDLNLTITYPNGNIYTRTGQRIREFVEGYDTPLNWSDNVFKITGSWTTGFPSGASRISTITEPLVVKMTCPHIVKGILSVTINEAILLINWGDGTCDNIATGTYNGNTFTITL